VKKKHKKLSLENSSTPEIPSDDFSLFLACLLIYLSIFQKEIRNA